jgi:hypothetical protein
MIPEAYRDVAMLTYPNDPWHTMTFRPCDGSAESYFAGGFAIREPVCLPLQVSCDGRTEQLLLGFDTSC